MAELPPEISCSVLPNHCNVTSERCNATYRLLSACAHASRTYCMLLKTEHSTSLSDCLMRFYYWQYAGDLKTGLLSVKPKEACGKVSLSLYKTRQITQLFPSFNFLQNRN